jgi:hypothetical protein
MLMSEIHHIHEDIEVLKRDVAIIKHILSEEGELTEEAKARLDAARRTPKEEYIDHEECSFLGTESSQISQKITQAHSG